MTELFKIKLISSLIAALILLPPLIMRLARGRRGWFRSLVIGGLSFLVLADLATCGILLLIRFGGLETEWRGGYIPIVTWHKTKPDFEAVERRRAEQAKLAPTNALVAAGADTLTNYASEWPGFRGPGSSGDYTNRAILTDWPTNGLRLLWKQACGGGYSSFALAGGRAFTLEQRRENEALVAYDLETGRELWADSWPAKFVEYHSDEGPRSTPTFDEGKVYSLGATGEFRCTEAATGKVLWGTNIMTENKASLPDYGLASSPLIVGEKLVLQPDAYKGFSVVCYNKDDGKMIWHSLDMPMGYATPMLFNPGGEEQVVVCARPWIVGLRLSDGAERWRYQWHVNNNERPITQPIRVGTNALIVSAAYATGCARFEVVPTNGGWEAREVWKTKSLKSKFSAPVIWKDHIYGLDEDILACVDATTGERNWKDGRYGYGQVLLASGHLLVQCANGDLALIDPTPEKLTEVARFPALHGKSWNEPAIGEGKILLRNSAEMACYEIVAGK